LHHLLGADLVEEALSETVMLLRLYWEDNRPSAAISVFDQLGQRGIEIPPSGRIYLAWASMQLSELESAEYWLSRCDPADPLEIAWKHGLLAEFYKARGMPNARQLALEEIDKAISVCHDYQRKVSRDPHATRLARRRLRAYRQDRARILQFLFSKTRMQQEYEELNREWADWPEAWIDLAVVKRNYAECLRIWPETLKTLDGNSRTIFCRG
jgi:hypothetical protein